MFQDAERERRVAVSSACHRSRCYSPENVATVCPWVGCGRRAPTSSTQRGRHLPAERLIVVPSMRLRSLPMLTTGALSARICTHPKGLRGRGRGPAFGSASVAWRPAQRNGRGWPTSTRGCNCHVIASRHRQPLRLATTGLILTQTPRPSTR